MSLFGSKLDFHRRVDWHSDNRFCYFFPVSIFFYHHVFLPFSLIFLVEKFTQWGWKTFARTTEFAEGSVYRRQFVEIFPFESIIFSRLHLQACFKFDNSWCHFYSRFHMKFFGCVVSSVWHSLQNTNLTFLWMTASRPTASSIKNNAYKSNFLLIL